MFLKKLFTFLLLASSLFVLAEEPTEKFKFYGFIRNDFYFNSRQNVESVDGVFHLFPKPISLNSENEDIYDTPQAELLSVSTRLGVDINGSLLFGAKSSAKIETDFSGFSSNYYVVRIRQAYVRLNWEETELLVGQTWHPLFGSVMPTVPSLNTGAPFQPFNRSPQIRIKQNLNSSLSLTAAAIYQMQYTSQGPLGSSNLYLKKALLPDIYLGAENKTSHWTSGIGVDVKTIKPDTKNITSASAVIYTQYANTNFQLKAKALWGENMSDHLMLSGYGVSKLNSDSTSAEEYTNFNIVSTWINAVYGTKIQGGLFVGLSQNLGTNKELTAGSDGQFTVYGSGFYTESQLLLDRLYRIAPHISYNLPNLKIGLEYDFTSAKYGTLKNNGRIAEPYTLNNHRVVTSMCYFF